MADLKTIADQLVNLTVKEVSELADILKDEYDSLVEKNFINNTESLEDFILKYFKV